MAIFRIDVTVKQQLLHISYLRVLASLELESNKSALSCIIHIFHLIVM